MTRTFNTAKGSHDVVFTVEVLSEPNEAGVVRTKVVGPQADPRHPDHHGLMGWARPEDLRDVE